jgi:hypothetical protein
MNGLVVSMLAYNAISRSALSIWQTFPRKLDDGEVLLRPVSTIPDSAAEAAPVFRTGIRIECYNRFPIMSFHLSGPARVVCRGN